MQVGYVQNCSFRLIEKSAAEMHYWCPSGTVVRVHDSTLVDEYAVSSITLVVVACI